MASNSDLMQRGLADLGDSVSEHFGRQTKEADRNRPIRPGIAKALGLSPDDEQEAHSLIEAGEDPKHVALYMKHKMSQPSESVFQGAAPGSEGGLSSNALAQSSREPTGFKEGRGLSSMAAQPKQQQSLAQKPKPYTSRDLEDLQSGASYLRASREPVPHETPEQRLQRERGNIEATGEQSRKTATLNIGGKASLQDDQQEVEREAIAQRSTAAAQRIQADLKMSSDKLQAAWEIAQIRGKNSHSALRDAEHTLEEIRKSMVNLRDINKQVINPEQSQSMLRDLQKEYDTQLARIGEIRNAPEKPSEPSVRVKQTTQQGYVGPATQSTQSTRATSGEVRTLPDGRKVRKNSDGSYELVQ